mmetsp:Transcript_94931/g.306468  ORF Transcript_94931/g.306468 Transcript_94931/m.306468 type:complete len:292 (+) Transcript_94931:1016-1891(+)
MTVRWSAVLQPTRKRSCSSCWSIALQARWICRQPSRQGGRSGMCWLPALPVCARTSATWSWWGWKWPHSCGSARHWPRWRAAATKLTVTTRASSRRLLPWSAQRQSSAGSAPSRRASPRGNNPCKRQFIGVQRKPPPLAMPLSAACRRKDRWSPPSSVAGRACSKRRGHACRHWRSCRTHRRSSRRPPRGQATWRPRPAPQNWRGTRRRLPWQRSGRSCGARTSRAPRAPWSRRICGCGCCALAVRQPACGKPCDWLQWSGTRQLLAWSAAAPSSLRRRASGMRQSGRARS